MYWYMLTAICVIYGGGGRRVVVKRGGGVTCRTVVKARYGTGHAEPTEGG